MMRSLTPLAFVCHPYHRGGVTRWMVDAATEWSRREHEAYFVVPSPSRAAESERPTVKQLLDTAVADRPPQIVSPETGEEFELGTAAYRSLVYARAIHSHVPRGVPLVISDDAAVWDAAARMAPRNPVIGVLHADDAWYYDLAARYHSRVCAFVSVSSRVAAGLRARLPHNDVPSSTIACGITVPPAVRPPASTDSAFRLVWLGRIDERQKRVSDLGKIAEQLVKGGIDFRLEVVGEGSDAWRITHDLSASARARVHMLGWRDQAEVTTLLNRADALLLPSNFEGMPIAAMEALAHGCAVVASDTAGIEEYAAAPLARECLWIYPRGDVAAAATAIIAARAIEPRHRRERARHLAAAEFSIGTCMDRYAALLAGVACAPTRDRVHLGSLRWARAVSRGVAALRRHRHHLMTRYAGS